MTDDDEDYEKMVADMSAAVQTHAGEAIYGAALIEGELERLLLACMPTISNNLARRLFEGFGPLNTFSAKIDVSRALGLINEDTHRDLNTILAIRNAYAHPKERLHFHNARIKDLAQGFKSWRPGCDTSELYDNIVVNMIAKIDMKRDWLVMNFEPPEIIEP